MMIMRIIILMVLLSLVLGASVPLKEHDGEEETTQQHQDTMVYIEHALEPGVFTHRGAVTLGGVRGESAKLTQNSLSPNELAQFNVCDTTPQHHAAPRSTTQYHAASRSITQHHAASRSITQHHAASRSITQHLTAPHSTQPHSTSHMTTIITTIIFFLSLSTSLHYPPRSSCNSSSKYSSIIKALITSGRPYQIRAKASGSSSWVITHTKAVRK